MRTICSNLKKGECEVLTELENYRKKNKDLKFQITILVMLNKLEKGENTDYENDQINTYLEKFNKQDVEEIIKKEFDK